MGLPALRLLLALILAASSSLLAQTGLATITGTVTDQTGAVIADASVTATQVATGTTSVAATSVTGNYTIPQLRVGEYEVSIERAGFKTFRRAGITLLAAQTLRLDVQMEVGNTTESVTITAEASLLNTDSGTLTTNITPRQIQNLPLLPVGIFVRDPFSVGQTVAGLTWTAQGFGVNRVNGLPGAGVQYRLDGEILGQLAAPTITTRTQPSPDAIEEVAVQTSNITAEFGSASGAVFNVSIKSGTNQFHGTAYDYAVNEVLNSADSGTHVRNRVRKHDYGFNIGGPIKLPKIYDGTNKSFFFFNWEQLRDKQVAQAGTFPTVPTEAYRNGDFSGLFGASGNANLRLQAAGGVAAHEYKDPLGNTVALGTIFDPRTTTQVTCNSALSRDCAAGSTLNYRTPFPGNRIPTSLFDPVAVSVLTKYVPLPNFDSLINNYRVPIPTSRLTSSPALKFDQNLGDKGRLSFTFNRNKTESPVQTLGGLAEGFPQPISTNAGTYETGDAYRLNYDYTILPTMNFHLGLGYNVWEFNNNPLTLDYNALEDINLRGATVNRLFPRLNVGPAQTTPPTGGLNNLGPAGNAVSPERRPSVTTNLTWVKGNHTIKGGADFRQDMIPSILFNGTNGIYGFGGNGATWQPSLLGITGFQGNSNVGFTFANFLMGSVRSVSLSQPISYRRSKQQWGLFLQDTWRARRNLTVDFGLRWDYGTYTREDYGRLGAFSLTEPNTSADGRPGGLIYEATCNCNFAKNYPYAIGPRVGVAYTLNDKTVLRGGFSIAYGSVGTVGGSATNSANAGDIQDGDQAFFLKDGIPNYVQPVWPVFESGVGLTPGTVGGAPTLVDPNAGRPDRTYQWNIALQREIAQNLVVEAAYVGNRNVWQPTNGFQNFNGVSEQLLAHYGFTVGNTTDAAILNQRLDRLSTTQRSILQQRGVGLPYPSFPVAQTVFQSIRPFPQYNSNIQPTAPQGRIWYDALQLTVNKRYSNGLQLSANYTFSKNLQYTSAFDVFNPANGKDIVGANPPQILRIFFLYQTPKPLDSLPVLGNKVVSWIVRDWALSGALSYQTAGYLSRPTGTTSNSVNRWLGRGPGGAQLKQNADGSYMNPWSVDWTDLDGNHRTDPLDINCNCFDPNTTIALNPNAWELVPDGQWAAQTQIIPSFRAARRPNESANIARNFRFGPEGRYQLQVRAEFQNVFNRRFMPNPYGGGNSPGNLNSAPTPALGSINPTTGLPNTAYTSGFGTFGNLSNSGRFGTPRSGQFIARFTF